MNLPDWDTIQRKVSDGLELTALEKFMLDWEPHKPEYATKFRRDLDIVLNKIQDGVK